MPLEMQPPAKTIALERSTLSLKSSRMRHWVVLVANDYMDNRLDAVNKHLEHIFEKLGVETRSAATAIAGQLLK